MLRCHQIGEQPIYACAKKSHHMFDIYLNQRNDLLVVPGGFAIPAGLGGNWKRKKRAVRFVSDVIRQDVQRRGYYRRRLISSRSKSAVETTSRS